MPKWAGGALPRRRGFWGRQSARPSLGPVNTVAPSISGTPEVGQAVNAVAGTWTGTGVVSVTTELLLDGVAVVTPYTIQAADDGKTLRARDTATDDAGTKTAFSAGVTITYAAPTFSVQPSLSPASPAVGDTVTLDEGTAGPAATLAIETFSLDGADKQGELVGLAWDTTGESPGTISFRVSATNSGGTTLSTTATATLSAAGATVSDQTASFGALTRSAPANGYQIVDTDGAPITGALDAGTGTATGYTLTAGGIVYPATDGGLSAQDGQTIAVTCDQGAVMVTLSVEADVYDFGSLAELDAAFAAAGLAATTTLKARPLDMRSGTAERHELAARAFTGRCTITDRGFVQGADATAHAYAATLPALRLGTTAAGGMQNVSVVGLRTTADLPTGENASNGLIEVMYPSAGITITDCDCGSETSLEARWQATLETATPGYFVTYKTSPPLLRGIVFVQSDGSTSHDDIAVERNYCHDVERGLGAWTVVGGTVRDNIWLDVFTNPVTYGWRDVTFKDNYGGHIWADDGDSDTPADPATLPHAATGPSGDAFLGTGLASGNVFEGGAFFIGWHRAALHAANGLPAPTSAATGAKANNPDSVEEFGLDWRDVLIVGSGISMEITAGLDCKLTSCTIALSPYANAASSSASVFLEGSVNQQMSGCLAPAYELGANDGGTSKDGIALAATLDTMQAAGNRAVVPDSATFGQGAVFQGHPTKGFLGLDWYEFRDAYKTKTGHAYDTAQLGIGHFYTEGGTGTWPALTEPAASTGTAYDSPETTWDGTAYASHTGALTGVADGKAWTLLWEGAFDVAADGAFNSLYTASGSRLVLERLPAGTLRLTAKNAAGTLILSADSDAAVASGGAIARIAAAVDLGAGRVLFAVDGQLARLPQITTLEDEAIGMAGTTAHYINAGISGGTAHHGTFRQFALLDEFIDLETAAGLDTIFTAAGAFVDFGADGANITAAAAPAPIVYRGAAASIANGGDGGAFALNGSITDAGPAAPATITVPATAMITALNMTPGNGLVIALRVTLPATASGGILPILDTGGDTNLWWWDSNGDRIVFLAENTLGTNASLQSSAIAGGSVLSVLAKAQLIDSATAKYDLLIDGVSVGAVVAPVADPAIRDVKVPTFLNSRDGVTAGSGFGLTGGLWMANDGAYVSDGAGGATDVIVWSDLFGADNLPKWTDASPVRGITPNFVVVNADQVNAGTNLGSDGGGADPDFTLVGTVS